MLTKLLKNWVIQTLAEVLLVTLENTVKREKISLYFFSFHGIKYIADIQEKKNFQEERFSIVFLLTNVLQF